MSGRGFIMRTERRGLRNDLESSLHAFGNRFRMGRLGVKVGLPDGVDQKDADGKDTGVSLVTIGEAHEFGTDRVPERSWLRGGIRASKSVLREIMSPVTKAVAGGKMSPERGLGFLGQAAVKGVKQYIMSKPFEPLAESTLRARESSLGKKSGSLSGDNTTPLVDQGDLYREITYEVTERE